MQSNMYQDPGSSNALNNLSSRVYNQYLISGYNSNNQVGSTTMGALPSLYPPFAPFGLRLALGVANPLSPGEQSLAQIVKELWEHIARDL